MEAAAEAASISEQSTTLEKVLRLPHDARRTPRYFSDGHRKNFTVGIMTIDRMTIIPSEKFISQ